MGRRKVQLDPAEPCANPRHEAFAQLVAETDGAIPLQDCYVQVFGGAWTPGKQVQSSVLAKKYAARIAWLKEQNKLAGPVVELTPQEVTNATLGQIFQQCLTTLTRCATVAEEIGERDLASKIRGMVAVSASRELRSEIASPAPVDPGRSIFDACLSRLLRVGECSCPAT